MVAWTHLGCQEEEEAVKTGSQVFERGARLGGFNQQLRQRGRFLHGSRTPVVTTLWDSNTANASKLLLVLVFRESG
jgi:hypothetical protein